MKLNELSPAPGSSRKRFRVGRGTGSGNGKTAGRGSKGQNSRSGGGVRPGFEGGQMPLQRRLPKRGFRNIFAKTLVGINVDMLERFPDGSTVNAQALRDAGIVKNVRDGVKILGRGELTRKLTVQAAAFSGTARGKIEAAGGKAEVV